MSEEKPYVETTEEDFIDSWACAHVQYDMTSEQAKDEAREFIARVRREAKAEALREAEQDLERGWPHKLGINLPPEDYDHAGDHAMETAQEYLKHRATEYETGDEHE